MFTFGSHSESHSNFLKFDLETGLADILQSKAEIEENLGVKVELLSWPYEHCPTWADQLGDHGFKAAFGGRPRALDLCSVFAKDDMRWCLPACCPRTKAHANLAARKGWR